MSVINKKNIMDENPSNSPNFIQTVMRTLQYNNNNLFRKKH